MKLWIYNRYTRTIPIIIIASAVIALLFFSGTYLKPVGRVYTLDDGWKITLNNNPVSSASLRKADVGLIRTDDTVIFSSTLPDLGIAIPCASIYTVHTIIDVYLDNELIYTFGRDYLERNKTVPKKYNYFPLGSDSPGKELKIILTGKVDRAFAGIPPVIIGERGSLLQYRLTNIRLNIISGFFLIALGLIFMILSPYLVIYQNNDLRPFFSGFISLLLGIYCFAFYGITDVIFANTDLNAVCEYSSFYNIPTAILGYLMSVYSGRTKKLFRVLFLINHLVFSVVFALTVPGSFRITSFTLILHSMAVLEAIISVYIIIHDFGKRIRNAERHILNSDSAFSIGILLFMMLSFIDIFRFCYKKYYLHINDFYMDINLFTLGAIVFIAVLLISYLLYIIYNSNMDSLQSRISSLAFTDALTGLSNRARCEQVMEVLSNERSTYTIISLDLNKLKYVNDTLGHHEGDRLLSGFATILSDCFLDANLVGRMGGDEFMVILTEDRALNCTRRIHELYAMINDWNHKEKKFQYSVSYGYAYSYEVPSGSAQEVYMLADSRMYEMKKEHRNNAGREVIKNA